jgi:hypothetical protein
MVMLATPPPIPGVDAVIVAETLAVAVSPTDKKLCNAPKTGTLHSA